MLGPWDHEWPMGLAVLAVLLLPGVAAALATKPFQPDPSLAPLRVIVATVTATGSGMLVLSVARDWWVIDDWEREATLTTDGSSPFVLVLVSIGLLSALLTVLGSWGRRNWAPVALMGAWLLMAAAWYASTGEFHDSDAGGEGRSGLRLATWALLLVTVATVISSFGRLAERHARAARTPTRHVPATSRRPAPRLSGWEVGATVVLAGIVVAGVLGILPFGTWVYWLAMAILIVAGIRMRSLVTARRMTSGRR
jgi:hypothetical protein